MKNIIIIFFILFLSSCKITDIYKYENLKSPKVILPADIKTIGFLDRNISFDTDSLSNYYLLNKKQKKDTTNYNSTQIKNSYAGFIENISDILSTNTIPLIRLPKQHISGRRNLQPLSWSKVNQICAKYGTDILVCLEDIQIFNEYSSFIDSDEEGEDIYVGLTLIKYASIWRIYDPLTEKYLHEQLIVDSLYTSNESYSKKSLYQKMPSRASIQSDVAYQIGSDYAQVISPKWRNIKRYYFVAGNRDFSVANYYLQNKNLDKAMAVWHNIEKNNSGKIAARAAFNLAFAYEIKEDYKQAGHWLRKSAALYNKLKKVPSELNIVKDYVEELKLQTKNYYRLNKFFGK